MTPSVTTRSALIDDESHNSVHNDSIEVELLPQDLYHLSSRALALVSVPVLCLTLGAAIPRPTTTAAMATTPGRANGHAYDAQSRGWHGSALEIVDMIMMAMMMAIMLAWSC